MATSRHDLLRAAAASAVAGLGHAAAPPPAQGSRWPASARGGRSAPIVAGVVIETARGAAPRVAARLLAEPGLELRGGDGDWRLAAVFSGADGAALEALAERLVRTDAEILRLFPTSVEREDD